ncbi:hypothetical protein ANO11243_067950 [Dothideomycetidae sp. 11243]|nr:hypothetical protein ANO11243_067950 [fungal sp. No.11243]
MLTKASYLMTLWKLEQATPSGHIRALLNGVVGLSLLMDFVWFCMLCSQCHSVRDLWDTIAFANPRCPRVQPFLVLTEIQGGRLLARVIGVTVLTCTGVSAMSYIVLASYPNAAYWRLRISRLQRVRMFFLFGAGYIAAAFTIAKSLRVLTLLKSANTPGMYPAVTIMYVFSRLSGRQLSWVSSLSGACEFNNKLKRGYIVIDPANRTAAWCPIAATLLIRLGFFGLRLQRFERLRSPHVKAIVGRRSGEVRSLGDHASFQEGSEVASLTPSMINGCAGRREDPRHNSGTVVASRDIRVDRTFEVQLETAENAAEWRLDYTAFPGYYYEPGRGLLTYSALGSVVAYPSPVLLRQDERILLDDCSGRTRRPFSWWRPK